MFNEKISKQISDRIDELNAKLRAKAVEDLENGEKTEEVLKQLTDRAVKKFTPESKMLLDSVYNALSAETLRTEFFQVSAHAAEFNKRNIQKDIESQFSFEVPDRIDYEKTLKELIADGLLAGGRIADGLTLVAGGSVVLYRKTPAPVQVVVVILVLAYFYAKNRIKKNQGKKAEIFDEYLASVKDALIQWIEDVTEYYHNQVADLEKSIQEAES